MDLSFFAVKFHILSVIRRSRGSSQQKYFLKKASMSSPQNPYSMSKYIKEHMAQRQPTTQIFVQNLRSKTLTFDVCLSDPVIVIKWLIMKREKLLQVQQQRLWYAGRELKDLESLESQGISPESTLRLSAKL